MDEVYDGVYWRRYHDLIDIRLERGLTDEESREFEKYRIVVKELDRLEAERSMLVVEGLLEKHERVLESIRNLARAVKKA